MPLPPLQPEIIEVIREVQDPTLVAELEGARQAIADLSATVNMLQDQRRPLLQQRDDALAAAQRTENRLASATQAYEAWVAEARRLQAEIDRRDAEPVLPERIGFFSDSHEVFQSPPPGREFVGENVTLSLVGPLLIDARWSFDYCVSDIVGGSTGPAITFRVPSAAKCVVTIYHSDDQGFNSNFYWVHIERTR